MTITNYVCLISAANCMGALICTARSHKEDGFLVVRGRSEGKQLCYTTNAAHVQTGLHAIIRCQRTPSKQPSRFASYRSSSADRMFRTCRRFGFVMLSELYMWYVVNNLMIVYKNWRLRGNLFFVGGKMLHTLKSIKSP